MTSTPKQVARQREMEAKLREIGNLIGAGVDANEGWGFCLMMFDFGEGGSMSYISNAQRADMIRLLHELLAHLSRGDVGTLDGKPQNAPPIGEG